MFLKYYQEFFCNWNSLKCNSEIEKKLLFTYLFTVGKIFSRDSFHTRHEHENLNLSLTDCQAMKLNFRKVPGSMQLTVALW